MKKIFSGIQPSGNLHIGNYIGAIKQWVELQNENDCLFCIVDLHAITVPQDPEVLREKILEVAALYIACGIDPQKAKIFVQSENPYHTELGWILNCITPMGQLKRMTQYKDKSGILDFLNQYINDMNSLISKEGKNVEQIKEEYANKLKVIEEEGNIGLFDYPVLMASDILLYGTEVVPVGDDQKQHIELTRDLAEKFNSRFGNTFVIPEPRIIKETARIMSLQDPTKKMSKSDSDPMGTVNLLDTEEQIRDKFKRAVTDSGSEVIYGDDKPAVSNLLDIYCAFSGEPPVAVEETFRGKGYGEFKTTLADVVLSTLKPIQERYHELRSNDDELNKILNEGRDVAIERSSETLKKAKTAVGLGR